MRSVAHTSVFSYSSYCKCAIMLKRDDAKWLRSTKRSAFTLNACSLPNLHCHPCRPVPALQHERSKRMKGRGASHPSESALGAPRHILPSALLLCTFCFTSLRRSLPVTAQVGRNPIFFFCSKMYFCHPLCVSISLMSPPASYWPLCILQFAFPFCSYCFQLLS